MDLHTWNDTNPQDSFEVVDLAGRTKLENSIQVQVQSRLGNTIIGVIDQDSPPQEGEEFRVYMKTVNGESKLGWCNFGVCENVILWDGHTSFSSEEGYFTVRYIKQMV